MIEADITGCLVKSPALNRHLSKLIEIRTPWGELDLKWKDEYIHHNAPFALLLKDLKANLDVQSRLDTNFMATLTPEQRHTFENLPLNMRRHLPQVEALIRKFPTALATGNSELKKQLYNALTTFISDFNLEWKDEYTQDFPLVFKDLQENLDITMRLDSEFMATRAEEKVLTIKDFPESMCKGLNGVKGFVLALPGLKMSGNSKLKNQSYLALLKYIREYKLEWKDDYAQDLPLVIMDLKAKLDAKLRSLYDYDAILKNVKGLKLDKRVEIPLPPIVGERKLPTEKEAADIFTPLPHAVFEEVLSGYKPSTATPAEKENEGSGEGPVAIGWTSGVVGAAMATLNKERKKRKRNVRVETGSIENPQHKAPNNQGTESIEDQLLNAIGMDNAKKDQKATNPLLKHKVNKQENTKLGTKTTQSKVTKNASKQQKTNPNLLTSASAEDWFETMNIKGSLITNTEDKDENGNANDANT
ncbi:hypothetical protein FPQ18DRAFT_391938 [Pyronema domesticum]|nr:hypothetical protein FPQ18DRAFT_391938 [Pyronema domesticum]